ncbi:MAG: hypothetical protein Kow0074_11740 [Candidatus Zixiibacteriota bacterium]
MKRPLRISSLVIIFLLVTMMIGCSDDVTTMSGTSDELNLTSTFGGYDDADEAPAFGDEMIAGLAGSDPEFNDDILSADAADSLELHARAIFVLGIRWGQLEFDSANTTPTDWSGMLHLKYGSIRIHRPILFERGQDEIVRPRTERETVEWVSQTTVHYDGILVSIIIPPTPEGEDWSDNTLTFTTPPYTREFAISELTELDEIVDVDDLGNQVAFNARDLDLIPCGGGSLDGKWVMNDVSGRGHFFGRWMSEDGLLAGHLRGHFGTLPDGEKVFFGKYIGLDGRFRGFLRGTWGMDESPVVLDDGTEVYEGWFEGEWAGRPGTPVGKVEGRWSSIVPEDLDDEIGPQRPGHGRERNPREHPVFGNASTTAGFFSGIWSALCDDDAGDGDLSL